ncbi:MAG: thiamine diphosphokinase [Flavobacteriaceae bacterium]
MNTKPVFLLLKGEPPKALPNMTDYDLICATDGAYGYLEKNNIKPHFISGDFDSVNHFSKDVEVIHTPNQNFTDFQKILQILFDRGYTNIHVYGASGREQDHFLGNLHAAIQWRDKLKLRFFDDYGYYFLASAQTELLKCKNKIVSLVPFPTAMGIITEGLQYPLNNEDLTLGTRIGTRNKAISNKVYINTAKGNLFIFVNN